MDSSAETFTSPHRPTGWFGLAVMALLLVSTFSSGTGMVHLAFASAVLLFAGVIVVVFIRPGVVVSEGHLLIRNSLSDVLVPWQAIRSVRVRYVMEVDVGDRVVRAVAFGRTPRQLRQHARPDRPDLDFTDVVVAKLREVAAAHGGLRPQTAAADPAPESSWRWPEIAALTALAVLTVVLALLA